MKTKKKIKTIRRKELITYAPLGHKLLFTTHYSNFWTNGPDVMLKFLSITINFYTSGVEVDFVSNGYKVRNKPFLINYIGKHYQ